MTENSDIDTSAIRATKAAADKIKDIIWDEKDRTLKLRIFVQGGGCAGMSYGFMLDHQNDDDMLVNVGDDLTILVDYMSSQYLVGAEVDYQDELAGSQFVIRNPNAVTSCGCGSSFTPREIY